MAVILNFAFGVFIFHYLQKVNMDRVNILITFFVIPNEYLLILADKTKKFVMNVEVILYNI